MAELLIRKQLMRFLATPPQKNKAGPVSRVRLILKRESVLD